jgi:hypothetical protein
MYQNLSAVFDHLLSTFPMSTAIYIGFGVVSDILGLALNLAGRGPRQTVFKRKVTATFTASR